METDDLERHPLFPSGEWAGFYTYEYGPDATQFPMSCFLSFSNGQVNGAGADTVGTFTWRGQYDKEAMRCHMAKDYATHAVFYDGHVDENGIWGTWIIGAQWKGGFHIWPLKEGTAEEDWSVKSESKERKKEGFVVI